MKLLPKSGAEDVQCFSCTSSVSLSLCVKKSAERELRFAALVNEVLNFELDGENPGYVDMPIWYTHNITNVGEDVLYTQFWISEWYDPADGDTYFEGV